MNRKDIYKIIKKNKLSQSIKDKFNKPYTSISSAELESFILSISNKADKEVKENEAKENKVTKTKCNNDSNNKLSYSDICKRIDSYSKLAQELSEKVCLKNKLVDALSSLNSIPPEKMQISHIVTNADSSRLYSSKRYDVKIVMKHTTNEIIDSIQVSLHKYIDKLSSYIDEIVQKQKKL